MTFDVSLHGLVRPFPIMPSRIDPPPDPKPPEMLPLDLTKRYDVYCSPRGEPAVVYRDVLFNADFRSPLTDDNFGEIQV
jgi:hypothetical protein